MFPLNVHLKPSRQLTILLIVAHCAAALLVWPLSAPASIKGVILLLLVVSVFFYVRQDGLLNLAYSIVRLEISENMCCIFQTVDGRRVDCTILGTTFVSPYLTVILLQPEKGNFKRCMVIFPDAIDVETFRQLRVVLRWKWKQKQVP